jgi:hypothetical protein
MRLLGPIMLLGAAVARCASLTEDELVIVRRNTKECEESYCEKSCCFKYLSRHLLMDSLTVGFSFRAISDDEVIWRSPFSVGSPWPARWSDEYGPQIAPDSCGFILMYDDARDIYIEWLYTQKGIIPVPTVDSASSPQLSPDCLAPGGTIPLI